MGNLHVKDTPFDRQLFINMNAAEQEAFLEGLRERRLTSLRKYEELTEAKKLAKDAKTREQLDKMSDKLEKQIEKLEKAFDTVMELALKMQLTVQMLENKE